MNLRFRTSSERVLRASGLHRGRPVSAAAAETFAVLLTIKSALFADGVFFCCHHSARDLHSTPSLLKVREELLQLQINFSAARKRQFKEKAARRVWETLLLVDNPKFSHAGLPRSLASVYVGVCT